MENILAHVDSTAAVFSPGTTCKRYAHYCVDSHKGEAQPFPKQVKKGVTQGGTDADIQAHTF